MSIRSFRMLIQPLTPGTRSSSHSLLTRRVRYLLHRFATVQEFLKTPQARKVAPILRVRSAPASDAAEQANKKPAAGVESANSVQVLKA